MALVNLPNLYCLPSDLMDVLTSEGVQLRLDDHRLASGQTIQATGDAMIGATAINVKALQYPLLAGTVLEFDGSNMPAVVEVTLAALALLGATTLTVLPLTVQVNNLAAAQDNGVNLALAQRALKACKYGTSQVKLYCCQRYDDSDLATSWDVNRWATALAAHWLCKRGGQSPPTSVEEDRKESLAEMKQVRVGMLSISDIATRSAGWPFLSNVTVNLAYDYNRVRVEQQLSEGTPTQYGQHVDWNSSLLLEW